MALLAGAAVLLIVTLLLWSKADDDAEEARIANSYAQASGGEPVGDEEPDRVPALAALGCAVVLGVGGAVVLAGGRD